MKDNTLQVLLVEDSAGDARLLRGMFSKADAIQPSSSESIENYLGTMIVEVQEFMNEEISRRTVSHGQ